MRLRRTSYRTSAVARDVEAVASLTVLAILATACSSGSQSGDGPSPTVAATSTAESTSSTPTPGSTAAGGSLDWDGVGYDYGQVVSVSPDPAGAVFEFDRWQVIVDDRGPIDAASFTEEPIVYANTDAPGVNSSTRTRVYRLAPGAELLYLANIDEICASFDSSATVEPQWISFTEADFAARAVAPQLNQTALTFDPDGRVSRVRVGEAC